jgi:hypothetical protein
LIVDDENLVTQTHWTVLVCRRMNVLRRIWREALCCARWRSGVNFQSFFLLSKPTAAAGRLLRLIEAFRM